MTLIQGAGEFRALAARHVRDSELLLREQRPQGAVYLMGYAMECTLKARVCLQLEIPRWTQSCLDHLGLKAYSHDLHTFAMLASATPATLRKVQQVGWNSQLRYHVNKLSMADGAKRHSLAMEVVKDIEALIGGI